MRSNGEASLRGRLGGLALAASRDPREYTAQARKTFLSRFLDLVDPNGELEPQERQRRALAALRLHMQRLALRSAHARRQRAKRGQRRRAERRNGGEQ